MWRGVHISPRVFGYLWVKLAMGLVNGVIGWLPGNKSCSGHVHVDSSAVLSEVESSLHVAGIGDEWVWRGQQRESNVRVSCRDRLVAREEGETTCMHRMLGRLVMPRDWPLVLPEWHVIHNTCVLSQTQLLCCDGLILSKLINDYVPDMIDTCTQHPYCPHTLDTFQGTLSSPLSRILAVPSSTSAHHISPRENISSLDSSGRSSAEQTVKAKPASLR